MHDDPEKNPPAGEDVFEERAFIISDDGSTTPVTWNHRVLMIEQDGEKSDFKSRKKRQKPPQPLQILSIKDFHEKR